MAIATACIFSCQKDNSVEETITTVDFRDAFIGKYEVVESINCYGPCYTCSSQKDTIISITYGQTDSTLNVLGRDVFLDADGYYYAYHYGLRMWNDSISSSSMNGGLGCGQYVNHVGRRISKTP